MEPLIIPCPQCGSNLKLRDPSLLGKTGKCPRCAFRFVLAKPQEVELELAEAPWEQSHATGEPEPEGVAEDVPETISAPVEFLEIAAAHDQSGTARLQELQQRGRRTGLGVIAALLVLLVGGGISYVMIPGNGTTKEARTAAVPAVKPAAAETVKNEAAVLSETLERGEPIDLRYLPHGAGMLIHLRPAELWRADSAGSAAREGLLKGLNDWLTAKMTSNSHFQPAEIEEFKICLIYGAPGQPVETAGVVTLRTPVKRTDLIERFQGIRRDDIGRSYYVGEETSYLVIDDRTFAFCPTSLAGDWRETIDRPATTRESLRQILRGTDRNDQFTLVFDPADVRLHEETLFPGTLGPLSLSVLDWFDEEVETVSWGVHLGEKLRSRLVLRKRSISGVERLQRTIARKFEATPRQILENVAMMNPPRLGPKRVIGRFPAMTLAVQRGTRMSREGESILLKTSLPAVAAANLALGTVLTWRELVRMSRAAKPTGIAAKPAKTLPPEIADRLRLKIDCDFRRTPLYEALDDIGKEIGVSFDLRGDDLKMIGVTQNMSQEFQMTGVPATTILDRMLTKIGLVIVIDPSKKTVKVTSSQAAKERGETPFPLSSK